MNIEISTDALRKKWPPRRIARWLYYWRTWIGISAVLGALNVMAAFGRLRMGGEADGAIPPASQSLFLIFELTVGLGLIIAAFIAFFNLPTKPIRAGRIITGVYLTVAVMGLLGVIVGVAWKDSLNNSGGQILLLEVVRILLGILFTWLSQPLKLDRFERFGRMIGWLSICGVPEGLRRSRGDHRTTPESYSVQTHG